MTAKIQDYIYRDSYLTGKAEGKSVLHLGCIGYTDNSTEGKIQNAPNALHSKSEATASEVYEVDIDEPAIAACSRELGKKNLFFSDLEHLEQVSIAKQLGIIMFTNLLKHINSPGLALE